ncbi:probable leucine-rich repeat receptor-like serine/threonine-protein kinase At3g14840 isoform X2 [Vigna unguiculata]|uniref:probable leucine-rich repeat receptor-like serine/threonine-protein kinase At3g14840 isoform X2 n=1 Tax=Vigna unguiculata TaxID=3917 RepID=UPI0010167653|nr:probable leucine-rich repeat receptor-like serine/threonine-protein kinase At3g14840 isoform X2 [Vigna unguiculata]
MKTTTFSEFLLLSLLASYFASLHGSTTDPKEVQALRDIAKTLGKSGWDFNVDPCNTSVEWTLPGPYDSKQVPRNNVSCDCSIDKFCHVTSIDIVGDSLQGNLPRELVGLPYIQNIDLSLNYLNGTVPEEWATLKYLNKIALLGNRLSGPFPEVLTQITTLTTLVLESNNFYGNLPPALGHLPQLERLLLSSNNFTGEWPQTFSNLTTLKDVRLGDNQFSGKIPKFIEKWINLQILDITGSGLEGPFPSGFSFPQSLIKLILRSCNINDKIPEYIGNLTNLKLLDLSYNKLRGKIPNMEGLINATNIYLTGNLLTGSRNEWRLPEKKIKSIDLSYNNFSNDNERAPRCQDQKKNLFASFSSENNSGPYLCIMDKCRKTFYFFHINCGGNEEITIGDTTYDRDLYVQSEEVAYSSMSNWAISNTGFLLDANNEKEARSSYQVQNISRLSMSDDEAKLYSTARISPLSLTYYGFCLANGNYTVKLHFAEIMFTDDNTYKSLGRRVFDVYIQGKRVLKDFNIAKIAQGAGKAHIENFTASVSNSTLEIRFYWAGKGSTGIPKRSVYGPLISAISVTSDFKPPSPPSHKRVATSIILIVVAISIILILVAGILWWRFCLKSNNSLAKEFKDLDLKTGVFTLRQIKVATNNFNISNKIGEGGFGPVYKGILWDGTMIAVKLLSSKSKQGNREFINEIGLISALQHPCLVKLYGCCVDGDQLLLVYEYLENNNLARALFGNEEHSLKLNWATRQKICIGIARGLAFLHEESRLKIVHRDIKATNVLLDKELNPKISDFGLAKLDDEDNTHISTRIAGTYGYMAPEYAMHGYLTDKADVYSFGIVALEIVSGKSNTIRRPKEGTMCLLDSARVLKVEGKLIELVDERLGSNFNEEEVMVMIKVALLCTNATSNLRPTMSSVVSMLEGKSLVSEFTSNTSEVMDEMKLEAMRQYYNQTTQKELTVPQSQSLSIEWPSSSSSVDLYPINLNSSNLETKRLKDSI